MSTSVCDVETEHERLSTALNRLHEQRKTSDQAEAALALYEAVEQADRALTVLLPQAAQRETDFQIRVLGLRALMFLAYSGFHLHATFSL